MLFTMTSPDLDASGMPYTPWVHEEVRARVRARIEDNMHNSQERRVRRGDEVNIMFRTASAGAS